MSLEYKRETKPRLDRLSKIGQILVLYRVKNGNPNNEHFAIECKIDPTTFSKIANGERQLYDLDAWVRIAVVLSKGCNGRRAINNKPELHKFIHEVARVPDSPFTDSGIIYIKEYSQITLIEEGVWPGGDGRVFNPVWRNRWEPDIRKARAMIQVAFDDLPMFTDGLTAWEEKKLAEYQEFLDSFLRPDDMDDSE